MRILLLLPLLFAALNALAQANPGYTKETFIKGSDTLLYRLLMPENFDPSKRYPVLFFLHGSGERGNNNEAQLTHGGDLFLREEVRREFPAIVIFPQCPQNDFWANVTFGKTPADRFQFQQGGEPGKAMKALLSLIDHYRVLDHTDNKRFYIGGLSMGGMGTLEVLRRKPRIFAAAFPICGGDHIDNARKYRKIPLWFFHGEKDTTVPPERSKDVVAELQRLKAPVKLTLYPEAGHNSWDAAFAEPQLLPWLFSQRK